MRYDELLEKIHTSAEMTRYASVMSHKEQILELNSKRFISRRGLEQKRSLSQSKTLIFSLYCPLMLLLECIAMLHKLAFYRRSARSNIEFLYNFFIYFFISEADMVWIYLILTIVKRIFADFFFTLLRISFSLCDL